MCRYGPLLAAALLTLPATARADDWLALHPECAFDPVVVSPGRTALLYPRAGLPAVVAQGERLITRVRVPSGLTPPPGVQQDRALVGWSSELVGDGVAVSGRAEHRYPLRVVDVRPDGSSSLVYRATVLVPRWAAPGTYGLRLMAPGGGAALAGAVRIVEPDHDPIVALARATPREGERPEAMRERLSAALARMPVDVWVMPDDPALRAALAHAPLPDARDPPLAVAPVLLVPPGPRGLPVVLRAGGDDALVLGACDDRFVRFDEQLEGLREAEGRTARTLDAFPEADTYRLLGDEAARPLPAAEAVRVERDASGVVVRVGGGAPAELSLVVPDDGRATHVGGASAAWWPATPVPGVGTVPSLAVRLLVEPGATATVRRGAPGGLSLALEVDPPTTETRVPVTLRATPSRDVETIAWQLDEDRTAVGDSARNAWGPLGAHRVDALAIGPDGVAARASAEVRVETREAAGCDCRAAPGAGAGGFFWLLAGLLVKTGRVRRPGNSRGGRRRWEP